MHSSIQHGAPDTSAIVREIADLVAEANLIAGRWSLSDESMTERAAFRARKSELLERLNFATSPTHIAAARTEVVS